MFEVPTYIPPGAGQLEKREADLLVATLIHNTRGGCCRLEGCRLKCIKQDLASSFIASTSSWEAAFLFVE
eukprot:scaffold1486_cov78-Skeletonema_dohrnii-CCMP3373.AAC.4